MPGALRAYLFSILLCGFAMQALALPQKLEEKASESVHKPEIKKPDPPAGRGKSSLDPPTHTTKSSGEVVKPASPRLKERHKLSDTGPAENSSSEGKGLHRNSVSENTAGQSRESAKEEEKEAHSGCEELYPADMHAQQVCESNKRKKEQGK